MMVAELKLQPCVLELCKFFSQCLCRPFSQKTRTKRFSQSSKITLLQAAGSEKPPGKMEALVAMVFTAFSGKQMDHGTMRQSPAQVQFFTPVSARTCRAQNRDATFNPQLSPFKSPDPSGPMSNGPDP
ncbi:hypothetical protein GOODEAATRI_001130 [Goodea atripinnis]|uniref:Uncharacterized protein n=1 Tax=Goodea atripinnis TaxID=208336 RepID=A0ABV0MXV7_9TELE